MRVVVVDLDGTLSDFTHRAEHACRKEWDAFHSRCEMDTPYQDLIDLVRVVAESGCHVAIVTARPETYLEQTLEWLAKYGVFYHSVHMRYADDVRPSADVKREIYENLKNYGKIWFVLEDRISNVVMWRSLGITCLQCQDGGVVDGP